VFGGCIDIAPDASCSSDSDCFEGEACVDAICAVPFTLEVESKPPEEGVIDAFLDPDAGTHISSVYSRKRGPLVVTREDSALYLTSWDGSRWRREVILENEADDIARGDALVMPRSDRLHLLLETNDGEVRELSEPTNSEDAWRADVIARKEDANSLLFHGNYTALQAKEQRAMCFVEMDFGALEREPDYQQRLLIALADQDGWEIKYDERGDYDLFCNFLEQRSADLMTVWISPSRQALSAELTSSFVLREAPVEFDIREGLGAALPSGEPLATDANGNTIAVHLLDTLFDNRIFLSQRQAGEPWRTRQLHVAPEGIAFPAAYIIPHPHRPMTGRILLYTFDTMNMSTDVLDFEWDGDVITQVEPLLEDEAKPNYLDISQDASGYVHFIYTNGADNQIRYKKQ
jgi:hypothetical protein